MKNPFALSALLVSLTALSSVHAASCCRAKSTEPSAAVTTVLPGNSLYQQSTTWTDDHGKPVSLADGRGRVRVLAMFYSDCTTACPLVLAKLQKAESNIPEAAKSKVDFVLVSFDPKTDTPAKLHAFRASRHLDDAKWQLLSGTPGDVRELSALLDVRYKTEANGTIAHTNIVTVLNGDGAIVYQETGTSIADSKLAEHIAELAQ